MSDHAGRSEVARQLAPGGAESARGETEAGVCHECGAVGQSEAFCDSCGAVLRARALTTAAPSPAAAPVPAPEVRAPGPRSATSGRSGDFARPVLDDAGGNLAPAGSRDAVRSPGGYVHRHGDPAPPPYSSAGPFAASESTNAAGADPHAAPGFFAAPRQEPSRADAAEWAGAPGTAVSQAAIASAPAPEAAPEPGPEAVPALRAVAAPEAVPELDSAAAPEAVPKLGAVAEAVPELDAAAGSRSPGAGEILSRLSNVPRVVGNARYDDTEHIAVDAAAFAGPVATPTGPAGPAVPLPGAQPAVPLVPTARTGFDQRARELIVPVGDPVPEHRIVPVHPGMPEPARPTVRTPRIHEFAGGVPCPWCSTPNPVGRHFCCRCALSLETRPRGTRLPWWRRLLKRRRKVPYAGQRPRLRHGMGRLVRWTVALAVVAVLGIELDSHASSGVMDVEDHFARPQQIFADSWSASSSDPAHPLRYLDDSYNNTWWGTGAPGSGDGAYVEARFDQPIDLLDLIITPGAGVEEDTFTAQSRPQMITVTLYQADGSTTQNEITLADSPGPQTFAVRGNDLTRVRFTVKSAYQADVSGFSEVAVSDIEFFVRSTAHAG